MRGKAVSGLLLTLLLVGMSTLAFDIQPVEASETIYIRADGSIDPPTAPIQRDGNLYTFIGNTVNDSLVVERDNIVIDGGGYSMQGPEGYGISVGINVTGRINVTIQNLGVGKFYYGILLNLTSNSKIVHCYSGTNSVGISIVSSSDNTVCHNQASRNNFAGISISSSSNNTLYKNWIWWHHQLCHWAQGISLWSCSNHNIYENEIFDNDRGIQLNNSLNNTFCHNNLANDVYQVYLENLGYDNFWDYDYPSGGNYWSDYNGSDLYRGPYQNETGSDDIGDTPYVIDADNIDHYPLMYGGVFYQLTVTSSPITGVQFTISGAPKTTPYTESLLAASYTLEMPQTHEGSIWYQWLDDGDTNRTKIVTVDRGLTLTATYAPPPTPAVGGIYIPTNKLSLLAPYIGLTILLAVAAATVVYVKKRKKA